METTIQEIIARIPAAFIAERAEGVNAVIQAHLEGDGGGDWYAVIRDSALEIVSGVHYSPNLTVRASAKDALELYAGRMNPMTAFMQGKVRVSGDTGLAMRLIGMFRMP